MKKLLLGLLVGLGLFLVYVATQPADYQISRKVEIAASPSKVFGNVNGAQVLDAWMPWKESDPELRMSYTGPATGVGSKARWESPGKMGTGQSTIVESIPNRLIRSQIEYEKPFVMNQVSTIQLEPQGPSTVVSWSVSGRNTFIGRIFCVFINMDKAVGENFEKGLARLKELAEK